MMFYELVYELVCFFEMEVCLFDGFFDVDVWSINYRVL
jgi:hypothetical protein